MEDTHPPKLNLVLPFSISIENYSDSESADRRVSLKSAVREKQKKSEGGSKGKGCGISNYLPPRIVGLQKKIRGKKTRLPHHIVVNYLRLLPAEAKKKTVTEEERRTPAASREYHTLLVEYLSTIYLHPSPENITGSSNTYQSYL